MDLIQNTFDFDSYSSIYYNFEAVLTHNFECLDSIIKENATPFDAS